MRLSLVMVAAWAASGCLSAGTVQTRREVETAISEGPAAREPETPARASLGARAQAETTPSTPDAAPPPVRALRARPSCEELARVVASAHPRVRAARERARAVLARSHAEGSLPPPEATFEIWDFPIGDPSLADHEGMYMLGLGQSFPAAGSRDDRARAAAEGARAELGELARISREVWADVAIACADWSAAEAVRQRLAGHRALVADMREAMLATYRGGGGSQVSVTRADAELAAAERHVAEAEAEVSAARATLFALAGGSTTLSEAPPLRTSLGAPDTEALTRLALSSRGEVAAAQARERSRSAEADAAEAEASSPSFEVRATYMQMPSERAGLGAMVGMSLPWLWGGGSARHDSARYELEAARAEHDDVARTITAQVARAAGRVQAGARSLELLRDREIPAAKRALESERASLVAGGFELATWIQAAHALREAHVDEARMRGDLERAFITLEAAVGRALPETPAREEVRP